jgi:O-antigen ligase
MQAISEKFIHSRFAAFPNRSGDSQTRSHVRALPERIKVDPIIRWAFAAFLFSIPYETLDAGLSDNAFSLSKLTGYLFIMTALLQPRTSFRRIPLAVWCFGCYLVIYVLTSFYQAPEFQAEIVKRLITLIQMLVLLWISANLLRSLQTVTYALGGFAFSCVVLSVLQLLGITRVAYRGWDNRASALGENPNIIASVLALGLLTLIWFTYRRSKGYWVLKVLSWPFALLIIIAIVDTGSRGAPVALAIGALTIALSKSLGRSRLLNVTVILVLLGAVIWLSYYEENVRGRWLRTFETGSMAGREKRFPEAWNMFLAHPIVGWGPVANYMELGVRIQKPGGDPHNLYLWVLTEVGLAGAIPYFAGLAICFSVAWQGRRGRHGVLPLALFLTVAAINMSTTWQSRKLHWLVLGYALAATPPVYYRRVTSRVGRSRMTPGMVLSVPWGPPNRPGLT